MTNSGQNTSLKSKGSSKFLFQSISGEVTASFSTRNFDLENHQEFVSELGLNKDRLYMVKQVHGEQILKILGDEKSTDNKFADGLITDQKNVVLGIRTADCVPVFFYDVEKRVVGLAHAGWRGAVHGIVPKMVWAFVQNYHSRKEDIRIGFGPCIREKHYEVSEEFKDIFPEFYKASKAAEGKGHLDLVAILTAGLQGVGIHKSQIEDSGYCTVDDNDEFYSHRAEGGTQERILSVISLKGEEIDNASNAN